MLALIAGTGALPGVLLERLAARGETVVLCELTGFPVEMDRTPDIRFRIETLGTFFADLQARDVTEVCFAGAVRRPVIDPAAIDDATYPMIATLQKAMVQGDDGTLRAILGLFESAGFTIRAAHDIAPDLLPTQGVLTRKRPDESQIGDALRAEAVHALLAAADIGQACVIRAGQVIAVEAAPGTDWMLASLCPPMSEAKPEPVQPRGAGDPLTWTVDTASELVTGWADWLTGPEATLPAQRKPPPPVQATTAGPAKGALFYKAPKPAQDRRADLPVIGPHTIEAATRAGISAVVIEAGGVMVIDQPRLTALADAAGIVLWVRPRSHTGQEA